MRTPIVWKEWHEQRWRLAFGTVMLVFFTSSLALARVVSLNEIGIVVWLMGGTVLSVYSAMGVFAPERSNGTLIFLVSKPAKPLRVFLAKWFFGWLNFALPLIAACAALFIVCFAVGVTAELVSVASGMVAALCFGTVVYTMTCCFAPSRSGEAFVGLTGILVLLTMALYTMVGIFLYEKYIEYTLCKPYSVLAEALWATCPFYLFDIGNLLVRPWPRNLLYFEQGALVLLVLRFGYWKWRRRS